MNSGKKQPYETAAFLDFCLLDALDADKVLQKLDRAIDAEQARIDAEVVALGIAPVLGGIVVIVGSAGLIRLLDAVFRLVLADAVAGGNALDAVFERSRDEEIDERPIRTQGPLSASFLIVS